MLKKLHKIIGLSICLIVVHLSITGAVLMYPSTFKLQDTYFTNSFIYNLYDMYNLSDVKVIEGNVEDIGIIKSKIIISDMVLETGITDILAALKKENFIFVLNKEKILLIEESDYGLKIIKEQNIPFIAKSIGKSEDSVVLRSENEKIYNINISLNFSLLKQDNIKYNENILVAADEEAANYYLLQVQGPGIQALRLFADLHNGRFFGPFVMFIFFITSMLIVFLSLSGSYMAMRPSIKRYFYNLKKKNR
jgi:hypothetical protein